MSMAISKAERPPCVQNCPAHVNCQGYVALVGEGRFAEAYEIIRDRNPFPAACGRICHHPCEGECNRRELDAPVATDLAAARDRFASGEKPIPSATLLSASVR